MKVMMRLYRQHDLDLIYLYKLKGFSFQDAVKKSIRMMINENSEKINYPVPLQSFYELELPKAVQFHIYLSPQNEKDIIDWVQSITKGYRNCVLKNVVRNHLSGIAMEPYDTNTTIIFKTGKTKKIDLQDKKIYEKPEENVPDSKDVEEMVSKIINTPLPKGSGDVSSPYADKILANKN